LETNNNKTSFNEIKGFLSLQLELRLELGFRLRLTKNKRKPRKSPWQEKRWGQISAGLVF
jgi:hypothetical protein